MVEYSITRKNKKLRSEDKCLQTWISFFSILKNLPKEEYLRYSEGFLLSVKKDTDISIDLLVSSVLTSKSLKLYFQRSFSSLDKTSILYLLDRMAQMWPREKDIVLRLKAIVDKNENSSIRGSRWVQTVSVDLLNYLLTGRRTEAYIENVSGKAISSKKLENIFTFPLVTKRLNS